jgi:hypothetical protein
VYARQKRDKVVRPRTIFSTAETAYYRCTSLGALHGAKRERASRRVSKFTARLHHRTCPLLLSNCNGNSGTRSDARRALPTAPSTAGATAHLTHFRRLMQAPGPSRAPLQRDPQANLRFCPLARVRRAPFPCSRRRHGRRCRTSLARTQPRPLHWASLLPQPTMLWHMAIAMTLGHSAFAGAVPCNAPGVISNSSSGGRNPP